MPVLFKTQVKESPIHGSGLFAMEDIPKGSVWWIMDEEVEGVPVKNYHRQRKAIVYTEDTLAEAIKIHTKEELAEIARYSFSF